MNAETFLALFSLLTLSTGVFFLSKRVKVPYTVMLVLMGIIIALLAQVPFLYRYVSFLSEVKLTPDLLFYIFLPILIFESAYNMNIRKMLDSAWTILALAIVGLFISTFVIAGLLYVILPLIGISIPFVMALLFGAIISSTDPVAVLALFKEYGAPKKLTMIFEGESLFNDGTAVALFMVLISIISYGFNGAETLIDGGLMFLGMMFFGVLFGLVAATLFSQALRVARSNEFATVTLLLISAHLVFILSEMINEKGIFGLHIHVSAIIATTVASLFLGNYSRHILRPATGVYLDKFIEHMAFIANSLVFVLAGLLFASAQINVTQLWEPILLSVLVVAVARVIAVMTVTSALNASRIEERVPKKWQLLLSWGSLRGALAIIMVLLIPENIVVDGWTYDVAPRDFLLAITIGCILATLFIKAPLMKKIINGLNINERDPLTRAHALDIGKYYLLTEMSRFRQHKTRGFVDSVHYEELYDKLRNRRTVAEREREALRMSHGQNLFTRSLTLIAIAIESRVLDNLYTNNEVDERIYRTIKGKLNVQSEHAEYVKDEHSEVDPSRYTDRKDVFDALARLMQSMFERKVDHKKYVIGRLQYYRAQMIMARKTVRILKLMQEEYDEPVFDSRSYDKVVARYEKYRQNSKDKMEALTKKYEKDLTEYLGALAERALNASGLRALDYLHTKGVTSEELEHDVKEYFMVTVDKHRRTPI